MAHSLAKTVVFLFSLLLLPSICFPLDPTVCGGQEKALLNFSRCDVDGDGFFDGLLSRCMETCGMSMDVSCRDACALQTIVKNCRMDTGVKEALGTKCHKFYFSNGRPMTKEQCGQFVTECFTHFPAISNEAKTFDRVVRDTSSQTDLRQCANKSISLHDEVREDGLKWFIKKTLTFCHQKCTDEFCTNACFLSHFIEKCKDIDGSVAYVCKKASSDFISHKDCATLENDCKSEFYKSDNSFNKCRYLSKNSSRAIARLTEEGKKFLTDVEKDCGDEAACFNEAVTKQNIREIMDLACPEATKTFAEGSEHLCKDLDGCYTEFVGIFHPTTTTTTTISTTTTAKTTTSEVIEDGPQKSNEKQVEKKPAAESHETKKEKWWKEEKKRILTAYGYLWLMLLGVGLVLALFCVRIWFFQE